MPWSTRDVKEHQIPFLKKKLLSDALPLIGHYSYSQNGKWVFPDNISMMSGIFQMVN